MEALHDAAEQLARLNEQLRLGAPDEATAAEGEAYILRVFAANLASASLRHVLSPGGLVRAMPTFGFPNPDYLMSSAMIDSKAEYRVEGVLNQSEQTGIGLYSIAQDGSLNLTGYRTYRKSDGETFSLKIGPSAHDPDGLPVSPDTRILIVRTLHRDQPAPPAHVTLTGGETTAELALAGGTTGEAVQQAALATEHAVTQFLAWTRVMSQNPNRFIRPPEELASSVQGVPDTCYSLGYFDLSDGEWLEIVMPADLTGYWSIHAGSHWMETLPGAGIHDRSATADPDGRIRIAVGPSPPRNANAIITSGHSLGTLICRLTANTDSQLPEASLRTNG